MDRICDLPSFIVTGASASGKTTLVEQAIAGGYTYNTYAHNKAASPRRGAGCSQCFSQ